MSRPSHQNADSHSLVLLAGSGEMGERTRDFDWSGTPLGPIEAWPQSLRIAVRIMLDSRYAMWLGWGPDLIFFYNDAYARMTLGPKHPWALGRPAREVWSEIWDDVGPRAENVVRTGQATWDEGLLLFLNRRGFPEETYHTFSYSPIPDDAGGIGGVLCVVTEDTERTIGERRLRTLRELAARATDEVKSTEEACDIATRTLAGNDRDLPLVLIYLLDGETARLAGATGLPEGSSAAPHRIDLAGSGGDPTGWPLRSVLTSGHAETVTELKARFGTLAGGAWPETPREALVLPLAKPGQSQLAGFVVAGISPRLVLNDEYRGFLGLLAGHVAATVANARAYEEERRRADALTRLAQVFMNLLNNAAQYSEHNGHIRLSVQRQGSDVVVSVRDTGIGVAADQLSRIFEAFSQGDLSLGRPRGGLGIGLSLVKRLLQMHGACIEAKSEGAGKGAEFIVRIPLAVAAPASLADRQPAQGHPAADLRILVVDDNHDSAGSLSLMLSIMGNDTRTAYDGKEAVTSAAAFRPHVILLDIGLPEPDGYETCRRIRRQPGGDTIFIVAQTGWGQEEDRQRTREAGFDHHMVKPVDHAVLMKLLANVPQVTGRDGNASRA